jgi:hypothetical protein
VFLPMGQTVWLPLKVFGSQVYACVYKHCLMLTRMQTLSEGPRAKGAIQTAG